MDDDDKALDDRIAAYALAAETPTAEPEPPAEPDPEPVVATEVEGEAQSTEPVEVKHEDDDDDVQKRISRLYYEAREAKRQAKQLAAENEVLKGTRIETKDESVTREAELLADQKFRRNAFDSHCNRIAEQMDKDFGSREAILRPFAQAFPEAQGIPIPLLDAVIDSSDGNEAKVLHHLSKNLDIAEQLLTKNPRQQGAEIAKLVSKLTAPKPVSKAPPPIRPVAGSVASTIAAPSKDWTKMSKAEQIAYFDSEDRKALASKWKH